MDTPTAGPIRYDLILYNFNSLYPVELDGSPTACATEAPPTFHFKVEGVILDIHGPSVATIIDVVQRKSVM